MLREAVRIARHVEGLVHEPSRRLVVLAAAGPGRRQGEHHVRTEHADHPHHLAERLLLVPFLEGLLDAERVSEVRDHAEVLLHRVEPVRGEELFGPQDAQPVEELGPDFVLAAAAAGQAHERDPGAQAAAEEGVQGVVLVVRVRHDGEHRNAAPDLAERESESGGAPVLGEGPELGRRGDGAESDDCRGQQGQRSKREPSRRSWSCHCRALPGGVRSQSS